MDGPFIHLCSASLILKISVSFTISVTVGGVLF